MNKPIVVEEIDKVNCKQAENSSIIRIEWQVQHAFHKVIFKNTKYGKHYIIAEYLMLPGSEDVVSTVLEVKAAKQHY